MTGARRRRGRRAEPDITGRKEERKEGEEGLWGRSLLITSQELKPGAATSYVDLVSWDLEKLYSFLVGQLLLLIPYIG